MQTHEEILANLISQLRQKLEANGEVEAYILRCLWQLEGAANDYHLPNQPEDVLQGLIDLNLYEGI